VQFGARPLKRLIQKKLVDLISMEILKNRITPGMKVIIDVQDGDIVVNPADISGQ
jgi:ATP-dependent Clp protease ATP-binding subunit ClpA